MEEKMRIRTRLHAMHIRKKKDWASYVRLM